MSDWNLLKNKRPHAIHHYDVTLQDIDGGRLLNVAIYRPLENTWELLIDKHNYEGCKVIAWKERTSIYEGLV